jgi:cytochrome bd-I ubiquinol oxidase subunit X
MWYFTWVLGVGFAALLAVLNAMWGENEAGRKAQGRKWTWLSDPTRLLSTLGPAVIDSD